MVELSLLTWSILLLTFAVFLLATQLVRRRRTLLDLRPIRAYSNLPTAIDETVESNLPPHFSFGASKVGQETTVTALASADIIYFLVRRISFTRQVPLLVTMSDPVTLAIASDTLRKAFLARDNLNAFRPTAAVWYPDGERSLVFAAGVVRLTQDINASRHVLLGDFGAELAYFGENAARRQQRLIANSTQLEGQAIAYAYTDDVLIGEELFVGNAYLERGDTFSEASLVTLDVLRWGVIVFGILFGVLVNAVN
jgi:hypothetical protein